MNGNNKDLHAKWKISVTITTPVHIGSGEKLANGIDFIQDGNRIFIIDIDKLGEHAVRTGQYDLLNNPAEALSTWRVSPAQVAKRIVPIKSPIKNNFTDIHEQIRDGNGKPYIPGTSLKGAIRTALLWEMAITTDDNGDLTLKPTFQNALRNILNRPKVRKTHADPPIIRRAFRGIVPNDRKGGDDPKFDIMKAFYVSDCYFDETDVSIYTVATWDINRFGQYGWWVFKRGAAAKNLLDGTPKYIEALSPGAKGTFEITLNLAYIDKFAQQHGWNNGQINLIKEWITNLADYFFVKLDYEADFFKGFGFKPGDNWYNQRWNEQNKFPKTTTYFRVGWGSGWKFTTGDWIGEGDNQLVQSVVQKFNLRRSQQDKAQANTPNKQPPFPKTRRFVVMQNNNIVPPGWMKLDIVAANQPAQKLTPKNTQPQQVSTGG